MTAAIPTFLYNELGMGVGVVCKALSGSAVLFTGYLHKILSAVSKSDREGKGISVRKSSNSSIEKPGLRHFKDNCSMKIMKIPSTKNQSQMVRQAHHPELSRRANPNDQN